MTHYTDLELIEDHYLPGADLAAHLRDCEPCRRRRARLTRILEDGREEFDRRVEAKPEVFWTAQREAILQRARKSREHRFPRIEIGRWAVAATLLIVVGGGIYLGTIRDSATLVPGPATTTAALESPTVAIALPSADPWSSEELSGWEEAVAWESWIEAPNAPEGTS